MAEKVVPWYKRKSTVRLEVVQTLKYYGWCLAILWATNVFQLITSIVSGYIVAALVFSIATTLVSLPAVPIFWMAVKRRQTDPDFLDYNWLARWLMFIALLIIVVVSSLLVCSVVPSPFVKPAMPDTVTTVVMTFWSAVILFTNLTVIICCSDMYSPATQD